MMSNPFKPVKSPALDYNNIADVDCSGYETPETLAQEFKLINEMMAMGATTAQVKLELVRHRQGGVGRLL